MSRTFLPAGILVILLPIFLSAQPRDAVQSVILLGNLVDLQSVQSFTSQVSDIAQNFDHECSILLNGDFLDSKQNFSDQLKRLDTLLSGLGEISGTKVVMLPGDRDWQNSGREGWEFVQLLEEYVEKNYPEVIWPVKDGCPGPERVNLGLTLNLIAINTQWWNHPYLRPTPESADCDLAAEEAILEEIEDQIEEVAYGNLLVAGHFPIFSNGEYGGRFPATKWLFPVPVYSTFRTAYRQNVGTSTETSNEQYTEFRDEIEDIFADHQSLIYVSGHEHNLELLRERDNIFINSGAPEKGGHIKSTRNTIYANKRPGFVVLHFEGDGAVWASIYEKENALFEQTQEIKLFQAPCKVPDPKLLINDRLVPCLEEEYVLPEMTGEYPETVSIVANKKYEANGLKRLFLGTDYRRSWTTEINVPVLNLDTVGGGIAPYQRGGGRQTKSLKFLAADQSEYVFRSVDKDPSRALSFDLRRSLISLAVRDQTTAQQPYGALATSKLLDELDILHARPRLYVMPDDEKLGPFRETFGNMLGMLEERPTGVKAFRKTFAGADEIRKTIKMFRQLYKDRDNQIAQDEFVRARVFDILIGDWGRHEDNWKWAGFDREGGVHYRPIPRDRDHVFSRWDGILPWLADREWAKPSGENFDFTLKGLRSLTWQARHMDRFLGSELTRADWVNAASFIQQEISASEIDAAMAVMPPEISADVKVIAQKLKQRQKDLPRYAEQYYRMLAKEVDIVGSVKHELFEVNRLPDGKVEVDMYKLKKGKKDKQFYSRIFDPKETKEIRLFGLHGEDAFLINGESNKSIKLRVLPGPGVDSIVDQSNVLRQKNMTLIYDEYQTDHKITGAESKLASSPEHDTYHYRRTAFTYNTYLPLVFLYYNSGNGLSGGGGLFFKNQAYGKPDFSSTHRIFGTYSSLDNMRFAYKGTWRHVFGSWDLALGGDLDRRRRFNYYFGVGNESEIDQTLFDNTDFYTLRYTSVQAYAGLQNTFWQRSTFGLGLSVISNGGESLDDNSFPEEGGSIPGESPLRMARAHVVLDIDLRDRPDLPTQGTRFMMHNYISKALNAKGESFGQLKGVAEYFTTAYPVTLGIRLGGAYMTGDPPFYELQYLGQRTYLRGYRQNRFAGHHSLFFNSDLRISLKENPNALIPFKFGLRLFYDVGRVYVRGETSNKLHHGYGAGIYFTPFRERYALNLSLGFSEEESALLLFGLGKAF